MAASLSIRISGQMTTNKREWGRGQWQGYVTKGKDEEDRAKRLLEVPISLRQDVERHVMTVIAIEQYHDRFKKKQPK